MSAELNGIYALYEDQLAANQDIHYLIATDTALGRRAAQQIETFLQKQGVNVNVFAPANLNTGSLEGFSRGMKELLIWCEDTIPGYKNSGYEVVFNLTAAFKSLQGYLNIIGMFYADRLVYIFEGSNRLLSIPQLPIKVDSEGLRTYADKLALMAAGAVMPIREMGDLPEALLDIDRAGNALISDWGLLIWNRIKNRIFSETLVSFPYLQYEPSFKKDFSNASPQERVALQETLADASALMVDAGGDCSVLKRHGGLKYDNYTGKQSPNGGPIGHFRITRGNRVSCIDEKGVLRLRHFGAHDYVNNNP